ncbi:rRNA biogenesis protein rrp5-like, partial [Hyposmocoma kahamanoa]|uniref:rRNA biogenesis protein rrp5-like n=1 Tax=Hyposmocoma kahamanoa TaxID=1477025 RepID=UPI000E6D6578
TVKQGTLILGRVRQVIETKVNIMLPCRLMGSVVACHISEPYNKLLEAYVNDQIEKVCELPDMFRPGQYVALKVLETEKDYLMLSMMPQHVNGGKIHADLHNGCLLQAAVSSVEDHGYVMDIGIPNTRAFLPKKHVNPEIELDVGFITWVAVKAVSPSTDNSIVTLTGELSAIQAGVLRKKPSTPLLPATAVDFTVDRPLDNGIEGHIFGNTTAYIQQQHADSVKGKKPALGQKIRARVLYVMPTRNTPFLTMRNIFDTTYPDLEDEQKFKEGDVVDNAQ